MGKSHSGDFELIAREHLGERGIQQNNSNSTLTPLKPRKQLPAMPSTHDYT